MKNEFKKMKSYFPYKIFQRNEEKNKLYLNNNQIQFYQKKKKKKIAIEIYKNLKSVTKSSEIFSEYMEGYTSITQDFCFKTPTNNIYPLRKNSRFLSEALIKDIKYKLGQNKIKRPISANYSSRNKILDKKYKIKKNQIKQTRNIKMKNSKEKNLDKDKYTLSDRFNNSIDLDNDKSEKVKNLDYLIKYVTNSSYKNYDNINSDFNKTKLSCNNILPDENLKYQLNIYSICLKFRLINSIENKNKFHKIYLKFKYLPIFYLLNFKLFKVFISEIISYDTNFHLNNNNINLVCDKYSEYINTYIKDINSKNSNITFYKNEFLFPYNYKWLIYNKDIKSDEKDKYLIYELKIEFPKIKIKFIDKETVIKSILKKSLLIKLMDNNFKLWDKTVIFELYFIKKIRNIINSLIKIDNDYKKQKINIFPFYIIKNINEDIFQFFISDINNKVSKYYIFNPYKIIIYDRRKKLNQEIQLNMKESRILYKYKNIWGTTNTLLKCIIIENIKDEFGEDDIKIKFKFDILSNIPNNYMKNLEKDLIDKKEKDKSQLKMNNKDIILINCSLKRMIINNNKCEEKLFKIKQELTNIILGRKFSFINANLIFEKLGKFCEDFLKDTELNIANINKKKYSIEENEKNAENENKININKSQKNFSIIQKDDDTQNINNKNKKMEIYPNKRRLLSANIKSKKKDSFKKTKNKEVKDTLFLTKNLSNNIVGELYPSETESSEELSSSTKYKYIKSFIRKPVSQIKNQKDLKKNRIMRNCYLLNNDFNLNKLKRIMSAIQRKKEEENIHNKY